MGRAITPTLRPSEQMKAQVRFNIPPSSQGEVWYGHSLIPSLPPPPSAHKYHVKKWLTLNYYRNPIDISSTFTISRHMQVKLYMTKIDDNAHDSTSMNTTGKRKPSSGMRFLKYVHRYCAKETHNYDMWWAVPIVRSYSSTKALEGGDAGIVSSPGTSIGKCWNRVWIQLHTF